MYETSVEFVGIAPRPEIASYAYTVLRRRVGRERAEFLAGLDRRLKRSTKTRRADLFAEAWVEGVREMVVAFAVPPEEAALVERSMAGRSLVQSQVRAPGGLPSRKDWEAHLDGLQAGRAVQLRHGMRGAERELVGHAQEASS